MRQGAGTPCEAVRYRDDYRRQERNGLIHAAYPCQEGGHESVEAPSIHSISIGVDSSRVDRRPSFAGAESGNSSRRARLARADASRRAPANLLRRGSEGCISDWERTRHFSTTHPYLHGAARQCRGVIASGDTQDRCRLPVLLFCCRGPPGRQARRSRSLTLKNTSDDSVPLSCRRPWQKV